MAAPSRTWPRAAALIVLAVLLAVVVRAPMARAAGEPLFGCGHEHTGKAERNPFASGPPPIAIGDSTMLLPIPNLNKVGFDVNAKGCRGFRQSVWVARDMRNRGVLPKMVLFNAYGNNGVTEELIRFALKVIGPDRKLILVTAYNADTGEAPAPDTDVLVEAARRYPDRIELLDWVEYSLPHHFVDPEPGAWFTPDLFHPNFDGAEAYAQFLARALPGGPPEAAAESGSDDDSLRWWPFAAGAVLLIALAVFGFRRLRTP
jgi:hypothetical protein